MSNMTYGSIPSLRRMDKNMARVDKALQKLYKERFKANNVHRLHEMKSQIAIEK